MTSNPWTRFAFVIAFLALVGALAAGVWRQGFVQALEPLEARGQADLALASDRLMAQLQRYREFAVLTADHPVLASLHEGGSPEDASAVLLEAADKTSTLTVFYADTDGTVLATSNGVVPEALATGRYFQRAVNGALGAEQGSTAGFAQRTYSFAAPAFGPDGRVRGVLVAVADIDDLEEDWRGTQPTVFFTDRDERVFVTNRSELLSAQLQDGPELAFPDGTRRSTVVRSFAGYDILDQSWSPYIPQRAMLLSADLPVINMTGYTMINVSPALRLAQLQAAAVAAVCLFFGALLFLATERRRALTVANLALEDRVAERTQDLEAVNADLRREVQERQDAEAALKRAQAELVQAGKLSALGQMSAGISHELNQPLMAIRSFADNATAFMARGETDRVSQNLSRISDMARRMGRIIKNLRAFARQESEPVTRVDLVAVIQSAVELTETRVQAMDVTLYWEPPDAPVWVRGGEVRLTQVFVNLISNAADAMQDSPVRELRLALKNDMQLSVIVKDTGPGITEPEKIFDPFYSTKTVGSADGMGLGLSISYGLVQSFGGTINGSNAPDGGAVFTVVLERWMEKDAA
ncbi:ATP-binding protein [Marivita sp. S6314]|uniref:sensor histidine kinase n=1 Tax=Marivita sp. S6314 TaxID=2926406 RepID=UPI001FF1C73E|nr:ATP-binding protein [Marivita sp. S6314]MCK0148713.1 ATP-binding protein [Marivita sp. S6314]